MNRKILRGFNCLVCLCFIIAAAMSCGYRSGQGGFLSVYRTISVPYVQGDWNGELTAAIVKELTQSTNLSYQRNGGALSLQVQLIDIDDMNIGFRYYRNVKEDIKKSVVPDETRLTATAEIRVVEAASGTVLLGPVILAADVDFDHDYYTPRDRVNVFSLGQLTDIDEAQDAATRPLNRRLARKIVDYLNNNW